MLRALPALVTFTSDPSGASVFIDGQSRGETPFEVRLPRGTVRLAVTHEGYLDSQETLTTAPAVAETIHVVLVAEPTVSPETATLEVLSEPTGATVAVDGRLLRETPLSLTLDAGAHELTVARDGYLENRRLVDLRIGDAETLLVTLTSSGEVGEDADANGGDGGFWSGPLALATVAALGGVTAAYFGVRGTNTPPTVGTFAVSPTDLGIAGVTVFTFRSLGASDPDGNLLTYNWNFGDGTTGTGTVVTHTYSTAGTFSVELTVGDGMETSSTTGNVVVGTLTGLWRGALEFPCDTVVEMTLTQAGTDLLGTVSFHCCPKQDRLSLVTR